MIEAVCLTIIFTVWFILSLISQFNPKLKIEFTHHDIFGLIPAWSFFAPNPGTFDWRIIYRGKVETADFDNWKEILNYKRNQYAVIWNPVKLEHKAVSDLVQNFFKGYVETDFNLEKMIISKYYLCILNYVLTNNSRYYKEIQFCILRSSGFGEHKEIVPVFLSPIHRV